MIAFQLPVDFVHSWYGPDYHLLEYWHLVDCCLVDCCPGLQLQLPVLLPELQPVDPSSVAT
jgi:hypothetical protein